MREYPGPLIEVSSAPDLRSGEPLAALSEFKEIRYGFLPTRKLSEVVRVCGEMREAGERPSGQTCQKVYFMPECNINYCIREDLSYACLKSKAMLL